MLKKRKRSDTRRKERRRCGNNNNRKGAQNKHRTRSSVPFVPPASPVKPPTSSRELLDHHASLLRFNWLKLGFSALRLGTIKIAMVAV
jgi:hypothetical protein